MKLTDAEAMRLRGLMAQLPGHEADWLYRFVSKHTEPCRRWPSAKDQRDGAIREAYDKFYDHFGPTVGSLALATDLARWEATGWKLHKVDPLPEGLDDRTMALHQILLAQEGALGSRQIFNVLADNRAGYPGA